MPWFCLWEEITTVKWCLQEISNSGFNSLYCLNVQPKIQCIHTVTKQDFCEGQGQHPQGHPGWLVSVTTVCKKAEWSHHPNSDREILQARWFAQQNESMKGGPEKYKT